MLVEVSVVVVVNCVDVVDDPVEDTVEDVEVTVDVGPPSAPLLLVGLDSSFPH